MISPPMVGVPALAWWSWGPSSRMCCANSLTRRSSMNFGPRKMQISIAAMPAIRTSPIEQHLQRLGDRLEAGRARALDEDGVTGLELGGEQLRRLLGGADELVRVVVAGRLADADEQVRPHLAAARVNAYLPVICRGTGAELAHLAEHGDAALAGERAEVVEGGPHGDRVGVVAVVHEDDSVSQLEALAPEAGETYVRSAVGHLGERRAQRDSCRDGRQGIGQVVPLGKREVERLAPRRGRDKGLGDP